MFRRHDAYQPTGESRGRIKAEIWILLALSLGRSGVYSIVNLIAMLTDNVALADQVTALNPSRSPRPYLDLTYQLLSIFFAVVPVILVLYFLTVRHNTRPLQETLGLDWRVQPRRIGLDLRWGLGLFFAVGIPGLAFYGIGRALGITVQVQASALNPHWWAIPVLILSALQNGLLEEFIVVGYLFERTRDLGWSLGDRCDWRFFLASSLLRGSYHLYQGIGPFFGNVAMGLLFAWWFQSKWGSRRVLPLVIAHTLLDVVAFVGYALAPAFLLRLLGF